MDAYYILALAIILIPAWFIFLRDWRKKPLSDFTQHLDSRDWRRYEFAIRELQKRGQDVSIYLPRVVSLLTADSKLQRAMGQRVVEKCYPEVAGEMAGYSYMNDVAICRERAAVLLSKFPDGFSGTQTPDEWALDQLKQVGADLTKPHKLEFHIQFPTQEVAEKALPLIRSAGYEPSLSGDEHDGFRCDAIKTMILDLEALTKCHVELDGIASSAGGRYDGWGMGVDD